MDRFWLQNYPAGVPHEIHPEQFESLTQLLEESFRKNAARPFSVCMERWMSYGQLDQLSGAFGAWLQGRGLEPGARVVIMLPNVPQFAVTMAGILRAGYTCVNVNPLYTARELEHQLKDSGATAIVILENFAHTLADVVDHTNVQHVVMASMGDLLGFWFGKWITFAVRHLAKMVPAYDLPLSNGRKVVTFKKALSLGEHKSLTPSQATLDSIAFLQYTGGTTGLSKGAVLTHRNIVAATLQAEAWFTPALAKIGDVSRANSVAALPLYHIFALTLCLLAIRQGSSLTLIPNPRDIPKFVAELKKRPFHMLPAVNTLFNALLQNPQFKTLDFSHLCVSQAGGMAASEGTAKQWQKVTGSTMIEGWGMSETCAIGTNNPVISTTFSGTIGLPLPGIDIAIKDDAGNSVPRGDPGESLYLIVRGRLRVVLDGDARIVTFANGSVAREVLVDCDDKRRRLAYAIKSERLTQHSASAHLDFDFGDPPCCGSSCHSHYRPRACFGGNSGPGAREAIAEPGHHAAWNVSGQLRMQM